MSDFTPSDPVAARERLDAALAGLPARPRIHELAKRAGLSSKEIVSALADQGVAVKSAQSTIDHGAAVALLTSMIAPEAATGAEPEEPPASAEADATPAAQPEPPAVAEAGDDAEAEQVPLFVAPAAASDGERDSGRSRRRRPRGGRARGRSDEPDLTDQDAARQTVSAEAQPEAGAASEITDEEGAGAVAAAAAEEVQVSSGDTEEVTEEAGRRRRRRGRRGRGRAGEPGEETADGADADAEPIAEGDSAAAESGQALDTGGDEAERDDAEAQGEDTDDSENANRRRRRRRRRSGGDEPNREDDPDNTVVHVRESRPSSGEDVQGVRGSTRLEAKRQRRRDSRESRRRPQILSEAEFLARREAVDRVMAVRQRGDLAQVALLEDGVLVEHFVSRAGAESLMGNIYLGKVQNVLPSMEAAFVDIGRGRNAVIYAGEVDWDAAGLAGKARRIETALSSGDTILVQVSKDPIGHKGARLTTQISLPGRFLVYVPGGGATGISRKLPDTERKRLKIDPRSHRARGRRRDHPHRGRRSGRAGAGSPTSNG